MHFYLSILKFAYCMKVHRQSIFNDKYSQKHRISIHGTLMKLMLVLIIGTPRLFNVIIFTSAVIIIISVLNFNSER